MTRIYDWVFTRPKYLSIFIMSAPMASLMIWAAVTTNHLGIAMAYVSAFWAQGFHARASEVAIEGAKEARREVAILRKAMGS